MNAKMTLQLMLARPDAHQARGLNQRSGMAAANAARPARARRALIAGLALMLSSLATASSSVAAVDFTWSGGAPVGQPNWANPANWAGTAPSNPVGRLSFPTLTSAACAATTPTATCYQSNNDISGLSPTAISIDSSGTDFNHTYIISGNAVTLGAGGITATGSAGLFGPFAMLNVPISLGAPQTWSMAGGNGLFIGMNVMGAAQALAINFTSGSSLALGGDTEVGPITATGGSTTGVLVVEGPSLNGTNGNPVNLNGATLTVANIASATTSGPLTSIGGAVHVGQGGSPTSTLAVNGGVTLDSSSGLRFDIDQAGTTPGTDYSQLSATGAVNLGGAALGLIGQSNTGSCPALNVGDVDTLVRTPGVLAGTFAGLPDGAAVAISCGPGTQPVVRINYTAHTVTATVVASHVLSVSVTGTGTGVVTDSGGTVQGSFISCNNTASQPYSCMASYLVGTVLTLTATPDAGSTFTGWGGACTGTGACSVTLNSDQAVTATFSSTTTTPSAPTNTAPPTITGTAAQGQTLTEHNGTWTNSPTSFAHQWQDCDSGGNNCAAIAGATGQTYTLATTDVGHTIRVQESATNAGGTGGPVASAATAVVQSPPSAPTAPVNTAAPTIAGSPAVGVTLACKTGFWSGSTPQTYAYQWLRDGTAISGATGTNYTIAAADAGHSLACRVTASNTAGSASATSASVSVPATSKVGVASVGRASVRGTTARVLVTCKGVTGQTCTITLRMTVRETLKAGRLTALSASRRTVVVGRRTVTIIAGHSKIVLVKLNRVGRRLLASHHKLRVRFTATQRTSSRTSVTRTSQTVTFKTAGKTK